VLWFFPPIFVIVISENNHSSYCLKKKTPTKIFFQMHPLLSQNVPPPPGYWPQFKATTSAPPAGYQREISGKLAGRQREMSVKYHS
jgi:hypothetical protein